MNIKNRNRLKETFYLYWMERVPNLDEDEAIDHLSFDLRALDYLPELNNKRRQDLKQLKSFLKEKKIRC